MSEFMEGFRTSMSMNPRALGMIAGMMVIAVPLAFALYFLVAVMT